MDVVPLASLALFGTFFAVVSGVLVGHGAVSGESTDASQKARVLAEGISEAMNWSAFGLLVAVVAALWLGFCTWNWRRGSPR
jgi:biopolymer transport protein ExbB/TolQ